MDEKRITKSEKETVDLGSDFAKELEAGDVILLYGDLGSGKTTFVKGLARGLGITERIISPTFVLHRIHKVSFGNIAKLNHIDLYRIENPTELLGLGLSEIENEKGSITIIEWADRLSNFRPEKGYQIWFKNLGDDSREIDIQKI